MQRPATDVVAPARGAAPGARTRSPGRTATGPAEPLLDEPTREVCAAVASGGLRPARLAIVAPGGYGKTTVLDHLTRLCERAGVPVARPGAAGELGAGSRAAAPSDPATVVLVDDAHDLSDDALAALASVAEDERANLVIAARPWPRPTALNPVLARLRGQVVLRPLDRRRTAALLGTAHRNLADFAHAQTHGVPGLVVRLAAALDGDVPADSTPTLPASAPAQLRPELDRLAPETLLFLLAAATGAALDVDLLAELLGTDHDGVARTLEAARAAGLVGQDGTPPPLVTRALTALVPEQRRLAVSQRLVRSRLRRKGPVLDLVSPLVDSGLSGAEAADAFTAAAEEATADDPELAARLYAAASDAGRATGALGARWAEVAARAGQLDTALRLADQVIAAPDATDRADAARTAATALVHRGQLARAAELYRWSGTRLSRVHAAVAAVGTGRLDEARSLLDEPGDGAPPTLLTSAMSALARGALESVTGTPTAALSTLADAAETLEPVGRPLFLPDTPAAVGALVGLHCGELGIARTLLDRALTAGVGGATCAARHTLLLAWLDMVTGDTERAGQRLSSVGTDLAPRDWLLAVGLRAGLARRASDLAGLRALWSDACEAVIRHRVDVFSLLPFGEFTVAAARLGDRDRLSHHLRQATELLGTLGDPPLWAVSLHWSGLHAAIMADQRAEAVEHVRALERDAGHSRFHTALSDAAGCWLDVLGGSVDAARVEASAKGLHAAGLSWDAARLAGQAAIRTTDRTAMVTLLECARALQGGPAGTPAVAPTRDDAPALSDRERQVAELVVDGMTYKQVGDRLFISAKTVEHHMARMRQRIGATSRADLLAQLRLLLGRD